MAIMELIETLAQSDGPDRQLDVVIARSAGYQRTIGPDGLVQWKHERSPVIGVPRFTASIDAAYDLVNLLDASATGGVSWVPGEGCTAILNDKGYCKGATPAIALCIAALYSLV
ncbi:hypothetical protein [Sinorhizobium meliloti]|uniref:hypothetical protein n=1 Tax=Rhizobium meliloti TaxID=382 RepID=UPI0013E3EB83|nr:hypothetical protein [Sinorhizobium meliloti]